MTSAILIGGTGSGERLESFTMVVSLVISAILLLHALRAVYRKWHHFYVANQIASFPDSWPLEQNKILLC